MRSQSGSAAALSRRRERPAHEQAGINDRLTRIAYMVGNVYGFDVQKMRSKPMGNVTLITAKGLALLLAKHLLSVDEAVSADFFGLSKGEAQALIEGAESARERDTRFSIIYEFSWSACAKVLGPSFTEDAA